MSTLLGMLVNLEDNQVMAIANHDSLTPLEDNITDEEKELRMSSASSSNSAAVSGESIKMTPHLETIFDSLNPSENDYEALFALSLLYAMGENRGGFEIWTENHPIEFFMKLILIYLQVFALFKAHFGIVWTGSPY